jgi:hypothetical protein
MVLAALAFIGQALTPPEAKPVPQVNAPVLSEADVLARAGCSPVPAGWVWLDTINQTPQPERHLAVHDQHVACHEHGTT